MDLSSIPLAYQLASGEQSKQMDMNTIHKFGIDGFSLMEVAGNKAADFIQNNHPDPSTVLCFCGKGNNAGDALVVARVLHQFGHQIVVVMIGGDQNLSKECATNLELLRKLKEKSPESIEIQLSYSEDKLPINPEIIVDGMFGTGLNTDMTGHYEDAAYWMNDQHNSSIYSMDIPSGIHADTGNFLGCAIKADYTLSFGSKKLGTFINEGLTHCGDVVFVNLPFPNHHREFNHALISEKWIKNFESKPRTHKYSEGIVYIIAGSQGLTGAAILTAKSTWAEGVGAVSLISPMGLMDIYEKQLVEIIKKPTGSSDEVFFNNEHLKEVIKITGEKKGVVVIGPGLGRDSQTTQFVSGFLSEYEGRVIIDADALYALSNDSNIKKPENSEWIFTPHPGELFGFSDEKISEDGSIRKKRCFELAKRFNSTIVSKGWPTIVGTPEENFYITEYDTRIFARAGFGDILAGKIAGAWLKDRDPVRATAIALIDGYKKAMKYYSDTNELPSPLDTI